MALQKSITLDTGVTLPESYIRITDVMLSYGQNRGWITVSTYASADARTQSFQPVKMEEFRVFNDNGQKRVESKHVLMLNSVTAGSGDSLSLDLDGDSANDVTLVEGIDFQVATTESLGEDGVTTTTVTDMEGTAINIANALNLDGVFSADFVAQAESGNVVVTALHTGTLLGTLGNSLVVSGNVAMSTSRSVDGKDFVPSDFEKHFNISDMSLTGVNVISQAYDYVKSLSQFTDAIDA